MTGPREGLAEACPLPFIAADISVKGNYSVCCEVPESSVTTRSQTAGEWFHGPQMEQARQIFRQGAVPLECKTCYVKERAGSDSLRRQVLRHAVAGRYGDLSAIVQNPQMRMLSYRFGNLCNFTCLMCGSDSSTSYAAQAERLGEGTARQNINPLELSDDELRRMKVIYLGGGEPTLSKECVELVTRLKNLGLTGTVIALNSNASVPRAPLFRILRDFQTVLPGFSIDGTGEVYELLRAPMRWRTLNENVEYILQTYTGFKCGIMFTLHALNARNSADMLSWWMELNRRYPGRIPIFQINDLTYPDFFQLELISGEEKASALAALDSLLSRDLTAAESEAVNAVKTKIAAVNPTESPGPRLVRRSAYLRSRSRDAQVSL